MAQILQKTILDINTTVSSSTVQTSQGVPITEKPRYSEIADDVGTFSSSFGELAQLDEVDTDHIKNNTYTYKYIASLYSKALNTLSSNKFANNCVSTAKIPDNLITIAWRGLIADGSIDVNNDIDWSTAGDFLDRSKVDMSSVKPSAFTIGTYDSFANITNREIGDEEIRNEHISSGSISSSKINNDYSGTSVNVNNPTSITVTAKGLVTACS